MKDRKLYYRRKGHSLIIEGKQDGKSILIWTLPDPFRLLQALAPNSSFLPHEKFMKITEKLKRLDVRLEKGTKSSQEVPSIIINRNPIKDEKKTLTEEERKLIEEISK